MPILALAAILALAWSGLAGEAVAQNDRMREYGEYLAAECRACHRPDGATDQNIPGIDGMDAESLVAALKDYKSGARESQEMTLVSRSLDEEQMRALGAYFASLPRH